jgi:hypothetical protein
VPRIGVCTFPRPGVWNFRKWDLKAGEFLFLVLFCEKRDSDRRGQFWMGGNIPLTEKERGDKKGLDELPFSGGGSGVSTKR